MRNHLLVFLPLLWIPFALLLGNLWHIRIQPYPLQQQFSQTIVAMALVGAIFSFYRLWRIPGKAKIVTGLLYVAVVAPLQLAALLFVDLMIFPK